MSFWKKSEETNTGGKAAAKKNGNGIIADRMISLDASPKGNGAAPELSAEQLEKMAGAAKAATATFGEMVSLLMRLPQYRQYQLSDLEWLVVPALLTGQFSLTTAQSKTKGLTAPVGLVLWAKVSEEVDKRLSAAPGQPIKLQPQEWKSGDILWVIVAVGDQRLVQGMVKRLQEKEWANKPAKVFAQAKDGKPTIATLESKAA